MSRTSNNKKEIHQQKEQQKEVINSNNQSKQPETIINNNNNKQNVALFQALQFSGIPMPGILTKDIRQIIPELIEPMDKIRKQIDNMRTYVLKKIWIVIK